MEAYAADGYDFLKIHPGITLEVFREVVKVADEQGIEFSGHVPVDVGIRRALEFGFGTGQNLIIANNRNNSAYYVGLDIDPKVKHIAEEKFKKKGLKIKLDLYDGNLFPYADNTFDKVFSSLVFHQLDKNTKSSCLNEINRVLKPDGKIVFTFHNKELNIWNAFLKSISLAGFIKT